MADVQDSGQRQHVSAMDLIKACSELNESVKKLIGDENSALSSRIVLLERQNDELSVSLTNTLKDSTSKVKLETARADDLEKQRTWLSAAESVASRRVKVLEEQVKDLEKSNKLLTERLSSMNKDFTDLKVEKEELNSYADEIEADMNNLQKALKDEKNKTEDLNSCLVQMQRHYDVLHSGLKEQRTNNADEKEKSTQKDYDFGAILFALFSHIGQVYRPGSLEEVLQQFFTEVEVKAIMSRESSYGQWVRGALNRADTLSHDKSVSTGQKRSASVQQDLDTITVDQERGKASRTKRLIRGSEKLKSEQGITKSVSEE